MYIMNQKAPGQQTETVDPTIEIADLREETPYVPMSAAEVLDKKMTPKQRIDATLKLLRDTVADKEEAKKEGINIDDPNVPSESEIKALLEGISGAEFLNYSPEDLRLIFTKGSADKFTVNFHGNESAFKAIGIGDLINVEENLYIKRNGVLGKLTKSSVYGEPKIGYEDAVGNYLGIKEGSVVELNSTPEETSYYEGKYKETGRVYEELDTRTIENVKLDFKEDFPEVEEGMEEDTSWESVEYNGDVPSDHMNEAVQLLSKEEGFRGDAYWDVNGYAIGYGTHKVERDGTLVSVTKDMTITKEEAQALLPRTIERHISVLRKRIDITTLKPKQFAALASISYNYGPNFFAQKRGTRVLDALKNEDVGLAAKYVRSLGENKARRLREAEMLIA